jgi:hypothetical protein
MWFILRNREAAACSSHALQRSEPMQAIGDGASDSRAPANISEGAVALSGKPNQSDSLNKKCCSIL